MTFRVQWGFMEKKTKQEHEVKRSTTRREGRSRRPRAHCARWLANGIPNLVINILRIYYIHIMYNIISNIYNPSVFVIKFLRNGFTDFYDFVCVFSVGLRSGLFQVRNNLNGKTIKYQITPEQFPSLKVIYLFYEFIFSRYFFS